MLEWKLVSYLPDALLNQHTAGTGRETCISPLQNSSPLLSAQSGDASLHSEQSLHHSET